MDGSRLFFRLWLKLVLRERVAATCGILDVMTDIARN